MDPTSMALGSSTKDDVLKKRPKTSDNVGQPFLLFPESTGMSPNLLKTRSSDGTVLVLDSSGPYLFMSIRPSTVPYIPHQCRSQLPFR